MSDRIRIEALKPGMVIVQITRQNGPVKIRKSGLVSSDAMVQGLAEMGVQEVEIDPEQTVEVAAPVHHRTQTQALLRGEHDTSAKLDHSLSDQFNRSLFLPTVQSLPSVWKIYGKQALTFAIVILGGLCIGFTAATVSRWWSVFESTPRQSVQVVDSATPQQQAAGNDAEAIAAENNRAEPEPAQQTATANNVKTVAEPATQRANAQAGGQPAGRTQPASEAIQSEGRVLNEPERNNVDVSPELMARFNKAVEAMDDEASQRAEPETKVTVHDNMPRVDQLPVRLLTRLPTMNFSAHMYASQKEDRWVRVNGIQLMEGDWIDERVQIVNINAQHVVLSFEDTLFTMAALTDW